MVSRILTELEQKNVVMDICKNMNVSTNDMDDFVQEIYMILIEYNKDKIIEMYKNRQLNYFLVGIIKRQYNSTTSPYYKKYKKYYSIVDENNVNKQDVVNDDIDDFE